MNEVPLYLLSPIWSDWALSLSKVDGLIPHSEHVNFRMVQTAKQLKPLIDAVADVIHKQGTPVSLPTRRATQAQTENLC